MLNYITMTMDNTTSWPKHFHSHWEIMHYTHGSGYLYTPSERYVFQAGTIIVMPPNIVHSTVGENMYKCISVGGDFKHLLNFTCPIVLNDNEAHEATHLARIMYNNRFDNTGFVKKLCETYLHFILKTLNCDDQISQNINKVILEITTNADDTDFNVVTALHKSGYSEDYIRSLFKKYTGMTPTDFLTTIRIEKAREMIDIWGNEFTISQIAEKCGFTDSVYFSKRFKSKIGLSPHNYQKKQRRIE